MAKPLLPDALWDRINPLLPPPPVPKRPDRTGRKRLDDQRCRIVILLVLKTGIDWEYLPVEMGCGSGMTCWRRLEYWTWCGLWRRLHELLLAELEYTGRIDWSRASIDTASLRACDGCEDTGPSPVDRHKPGSKHFAVVDAEGMPPATRTTAASRNDVAQMVATVDAVPPVRGKPHGSGLKEVRWMVERTLAWLHNFGRPRVCKDRRAEIHQALLDLAGLILCFRNLPERQLC